MRLMCSSTHWFRTRLTARCCANPGGHCTPVSPKPWKPIRRDRRASSRTAGASLHRSRADRKGHGLWGKAGQRSLERSALVEASAQLTRALDLIAALPATPTLHREEIKLQVALITPLLHIKGYAAPEPQAAAQRARLLIEQAEALGEPPDDPLLLFSVLYSFWVANVVAFNGDAVRELAAHFLALAEKHRATVPLMVGHRLLATSLLCTGDIAEGRTHYSQALALYYPGEHRPLATRFGQDVRVTILCFRSLAQWALGHPEAALADADYAIKDAREIGQAASLLVALSVSSMTNVLCRKHVAAHTLSDELASLANEKGAVLWQSWGMMIAGCALALTGKASDAVSRITSGLHQISVNWVYAVDAVLVSAFDKRVYRTRPIR